MFYVLFKTIEVLKNRFIFEDRIRISEFFDMVLDNLYKFLPPSLVKPVHETLHELTDEMLWL
ncbi:MAG: hypothetical protein ACXQS8_03455 [Candidatus Helarchaeales archaeon]